MRNRIKERKGLTARCTPNMGVRGQVALFIIIAIVIVVGIIAAFFLIGGTDLEAPADLNPAQFIENCVEDAVEPAVVAVLDGGGRISPSQYIMYDGEEYNYLCYQADYYLTCINSHPMLESIVEEEIRADTVDEVETCFNAMEEEFEDKGFGVNVGTLNYSIDLLPGRVDILINNEIVAFRGGTSQTFSDFDTSIISPLYHLIGIAREIVNQEAQYCNFDYNGYMILYPEYDIRRIDYSESKVYKLFDRRSGDEFQFAIRSCAIAPGI
ncbi:hypothetical protein HOA55_00855 [archaeon]|jgi:hypothetical protein|nr:hypothetical protein [archaeon]MBT3578195.1 hypothetical protein [archaeon]MBT6819884.1 hypothetical protein [archaeon]MBT6956386.1 hypothetical protein [archaeon]MBT7025666.1 hypothetical protein [archaeon]